jgi:DNA-binding transcriptional ArsR family regulator
LIHAKAAIEKSEAQSSYTVHVQGIYDVSRSAMNHLLWHFLAGTRGGPMRTRILVEVKKRPMNANQLAKKLGIDYKTVQHHVDILRSEQLITVHGKYGATLFVTDYLEKEWSVVEEIWERIRNT